MRSLRLCASITFFHHRQMSSNWIPNYLEGTPYGISLSLSGTFPHLPCKLNEHDCCDKLEVIEDGMEAKYGTRIRGTDADALASVQTIPFPRCAEYTTLKLRSFRQGLQGLSSVILLTIGSLELDSVVALSI
jgi:hypothetical protein